MEDLHTIYRVQFGDEVDGSRTTYSYDPAYQLISEQRSGSNPFTASALYDPLGNRLVASLSGFVYTSTYNAANELVLLTPASGAPTTSSYDANGNLTLENASGMLTTYAWDFENRLLAVASSTGIETYAYSTDGLRQQKVNSQGTTNFVWDEQNVLLEANASQITQAHYTDLPGAWGGLASERRSAVSSFYGFDSQSSTRILVSISGLVTDNYSYKAFGEELASGSGTVNPYRYIGRYGYYRDIATRQYVRARVLEVTNGRWISRDPYSGSASDNRYAYSGENPITNIDPSGLLHIVPVGNDWWICNSQDQRCCGNMCVHWRFYLAFPARAGGGYIAQYIDPFTGAGSAGPNCSKHFEISPGACHEYVELIPIAAGQDHADDWCGYQSPPASSGSFLQKGEAKYFKTSTILSYGSLKDQRFVPGNKGGVTCSGVFQSRAGSPPDWFYGPSEDEPDGGPATHRECCGEWDCCDESNCCQNCWSRTNGTPGKAPAATCPPPGSNCSNILFF